MNSKYTTSVCLILSVQLVFVLGQTPRELLFADSKIEGSGEVKFGERATTNLASTNDVDVDGKYVSQGNSEANFLKDKNSAKILNGGRSFGVSGSNYPANNNNGYRPSSSTSGGNSGSPYPESNNNGYRPSSSSSGGNNNYPGSNKNSYNPSSTGSVGNSGTYFPGSGSNSQGQYYPGNDRPPVPEPGTTVAFSAIRANTYSNSGNSQHIRFERTITDVGYGWNPNDSYFECNYPGTYVFSWSAVSPSNSETRISLYENGRETGHHVWADRSGYQSASETAVLNLSRGARVELRLTEGRLYEPSNSGRGYNTFSGFKLN